MGLADRDYMRERAEERAAPSRRRRNRPRGLEALLAAPFNSQGAAISIGLLGLILISTIPASLIVSMADSGAMQSSDPEMMPQMTQRGMLSGVMTLVPTLRLIGLVILASSGLALIKQRRKWGYSTIVKDPRSRPVSASWRWASWSGASQRKASGRLRSRRRPGPASGSPVAICQRGRQPRDRQ